MSSEKEARKRKGGEGASRALHYATPPSAEGKDEGKATEAKERAKEGALHYSTTCRKCSKQHPTFPFAWEGPPGGRATVSARKPAFLCSRSSWLATGTHRCSLQKAKVCFDCLNNMFKPEKAPRSQKRKKRRLGGPQNVFSSRQKLMHFLMPRQVLAGFHRLWLAGKPPKPPPDVPAKRPATTLAGVGMTSTKHSASGNSVTGNTILGAEMAHQTGKMPMAVAVTTWR